MQRQSLNVNIQPIMLDMNSIIESHITEAVKAFNVQYISREIEEHKRKLSQLEEELLRVQTGGIPTNSRSVQNGENILLEINDPSKHESVGNVSKKGGVGAAKPVKQTKKAAINQPSVAVEIPIDETKTNKIVATPTMGDSSQIKKVVLSQVEPTVCDTPAEVISESTELDENVEEEHEDEDEDDQEEEDGVFEIEIDGVSYYATDENNGNLYTVDENGEPGEIVGKLVEGEPVFE